MAHWIQNAVKRPGALTKKLGRSKKTGKIRVQDIQKAAHAKNARTRRQANLALTFRKMRARKRRK